MTNQVAFSLLDARNLRLVDLGDGTFALATALLQDDTGGGGIAGTVNIEINDQVPALVDGSKLVTVVYGYNGSGYEPRYHNYEATVLVSAPRTSDTTSADQTNYNFPGVLVVIDITAITGNPSITAIIEGKSTLGNDYYTIIQSAAMLSAGASTMRVYPGISTVGNDQNGILPRIWRVRVTHSNTDSITYSISANYIV